VRREEALGSEERIIRNMRRIEPSSLLRCDEQCVSLRRVTPPLPEGRMNDRIDEGTSSLILLW